MLYGMSEKNGEDEQCRDQLLVRLLKTPPQPRPQRERGKTKAKVIRSRDKRATGAKREPSV
jgi:hypothetical protein